MSYLVANQYLRGRKIGSGNSGEVYLGQHITSGEEVAIKFEDNQIERPLLHYESRVYEALAGGVGIPFVRCFETKAGRSALVLDLLGQNLESLFVQSDRPFSLKTILMLVDQSIARMKYIHDKGFLHRDLKPDNLVMGLGFRRFQLNVIDFGFAKKYRERGSSNHIPHRRDKNFIGNARFASINTHLGIEQSRRDDMEALGYVFVYLSLGSLPWIGLKAATKAQKYASIKNVKQITSPETLCQGLPEEFTTYLNNVRSLRFDEQPDYDYLRKIFYHLFLREGFKFDYVYDWTG